MRPSFALRPCRVVGMPVALAIFRLAFVMPKALFQLKESPGISFFLRFAISAPHFLVRIGQEQ